MSEGGDLGSIVNELVEKRFRERVDSVVSGDMNSFCNDSELDYQLTEMVKRIIGEEIAKRDSEVRQMIQKRISKVVSQTDIVIRVGIEKPSNY